ncbi:MAG TPA: thioredoxin family protein [Nitrospiria bacterium]|jgi:predicted dithiol-disulfide oxidoreductase (DUF899 family)|nr:thioredoxin family protein [Nitrospiria bacterium]
MATSKHKVVSKKQWLAARKALLVKEKKFTRLREQLAQQRRKLPWVKVEKDYVFDGPKGQESLSDLFDGKNQLVVYHFMFGPEWGEGCSHCSFWADHYGGMGIHLQQRDVNFVVISRAPLAEILPFKKRMGWDFKWVSSSPNDFNYDFHVAFRPEDIEKGKIFYNYKTIAGDVTDREGISVFYKDKKGEVFHTYSAFARGIDMVNTTYQFLDLVPKGRDENPEDPQDWVRYHDRYES